MILMLLILLVPLLLLLLWPVWFREPVAVQSNENRRLYQERTAELAVSDWSEDEKAAFQLELDREFLASDGDTVQSELNRTVHSSSPMLVAIVLALSAAMTLGLYQLWGASGELRAAELLDQGEKTELTTLERTELMHLLGQATQRYPEQLEWAYLNARLLSAAGDYQQAVEVFEFILSALPEEATADRAATLTLTAEARFFAAGQKADQTTYALVEQALSLNPGSRQALGLAGILAFELGNPAASLQHWKVLWQGLPGGPESQVLAQGIRRAAQQLQAQGQDVDLSWLERAQLKVRVTLSDKARASVSPSDSVFVLAKAVSGPPMPLAAQRLTVADLPQTITLSDAQAMAPGMSLSSFDEVVVIARVSKTGKPLAQAGDWQTRSDPVSNRHDDVIALQIDELVGQ